MDEDMDSSITPNETREDKHRSQHSIKIIDDLNKDRLTGEMCDVLIIVDGQEFPAHRLILKVTSPYFRAMFSGSFDERQKKCIEIKGVSKDGFKYTLNYLYGEAGKLTFENILDVYHCADMLCIDSALKECKTYFENNWKWMTDKNAAYHIAKTMNLTEIMKAIISYFCYTFTTVIKKPYFLELPYEVVLEVVKNKVVALSYLIENILEAIILWVIHKPNSRFSETSELMSQVPLDQVPNITKQKLLTALGMVLPGDQAMVKEMESLAEKMKSSSMVVEQRLCNLKLKLVSVTNNFPEVGIREFHYRKHYWTKHYPSVGVLGAAGSYFMLQGTKSEFMTKGIQALQLLKDNVYVFGSRIILAYNMTTQSTRVLTPLPWARKNFCVLGYTNTVIVIGGKRQKVLQYDFLSNTWQTMFALRLSRCNVRDAVLYNDVIYMMCGLPGRNSKICKYVLSYDLSSRLFVNITKLNWHLKYPRILCCNNSIFVFENDIRKPGNLKLILGPFETRLCRIYNIDMKTWSDSKAKILLNETILDVAAVAEGILVVMMKRVTDNTQIKIALYAPISDSLEHVASLPGEPNLPFNSWFRVEAR